MKHKIFVFCDKTVTKNDMTELLKSYTIFNCFSITQRYN